MSDGDRRPKGAGGHTRATHVKRVQGDKDGDKTRVIATHHLKDLQASGLSLETISLAGLYSEGKSKPIADLLGWSWRNGGALVFPFRDYDSGKVLLSRIKPDRPRMRGKSNTKTIKYEQAPGTGAVPYFGPRCIRHKYLDEAKTVYWTEGEKKGLLLDQLQLAHIAVTGCHTWNDGEKHRNGDGITWSKQLLKYAERYIKGKKHVLVFDSDMWSNDLVMLALQRLAGLLLQDGAKSVGYVTIPPDKDNKEKSVGIDDYYMSVGQNVKQLRKLLATTSLIAPGQEIVPIPPKDPLLKLCVLSWLKGAKLDPDLRLPPRFEIRRDKSLWLEPPLDKPDGDYRELMRSVVIPTRLLQSLDEEEERFEIAHFARNKWRRDVVDRKAVRDARRALAELPPSSAIDSNNAANVVTWLSEYARHNEHRLRVTRFSDKCGWQDLAGVRCFLMDRPITSGRSKVEIVADDSGDRIDMLDALKPKGSYKAHKDALKRAFDEDGICALVVLGALAAPLLRPLRAPNFGIHLFGDSSTGKTSKVVVGSSVYGDPRNAQWLGSWNTTATAIELRASMFCDLPLCLDEVGAGDRYSIERQIYTLINGGGKARAQRSMQLRKMAVFRNVCLSTGEHELASDQANTGAQVRILQFRSSGFGGYGAAQVDAIRNACADNAGHVGREWLKTLVGVDDWQPYKQLFLDAKEQFRDKESDNSLMQRQAIYYALLAVAEHIASQTLGFGLKGGQTVRNVFLDGDTRREVRSASERAIESIAEWIASEPQSFPLLGYNVSGGLMSQAKAHVRKVNGVRHRSHIYFLPDQFRMHLESNGMSYAEVIAAWQDRGYLDCDKGRKTKRVRWDGRRLWVISVKYEALGLEADKGSQGALGDAVEDFGG